MLTCGKCSQPPRSLRLPPNAAGSIWYILKQKKISNSTLKTAPLWVSDWESYTRYQFHSIIRSAVQNSTRVSRHISAVRARRDSRFETPVSRKHDKFNAANRNALRAPAGNLSRIDLALQASAPHFHTNSGHTKSLFSKIDPPHCRCRRPWNHKRQCLTHLSCKFHRDRSEIEFSVIFQNFTMPTKTQCLHVENAVSRPVHFDGL
jgi:hypothetical protein